jgi:translation initiation factor IF-1
MIYERLKIAQLRKKHYADWKRRQIEYKVGDHVYLKVSPFKGTKIFQEKGKLTYRYVGPFRIVASE